MCPCRTTGSATRSSCDASKKVLTEPTRDTDLRRRIDFDGMGSKLARMKEFSEQDTCRWLLNSPNFCSWKRDLLPDDPSIPRVLMLSGKPGCGKSVAMARAVVDIDKHHAPKTQAVVSFFFDGRSTTHHPLQKSWTGFYRSMLYQLMFKLTALDDKSILELETSLEETIRRNQSNFHPTELREAIKKTLHHLRTTRLTIFLDGLDECTDSAEDYSTLYGFLLRDLTRECADVRLCLSVRAERDAGDMDLPDSTPVIWVDKNNEDDIQRFLDRNLSGEYLKKKPQLRHQLMQQIESKASGTFLWVKIVVENIKREAKGRKDDYVLGLIDEAPEDLFALYRSVLDNAKSSNRKKYGEVARALLQHVQIAARPLTVKEAACLLEFASKPITASDFVFEPNPDLEEAESHIKDITCGLVEFRRLSTRFDKDETVLQFIHKSVGDFLLDLSSRDDLILDPRHGETRAMATVRAQTQFHFNAFKLSLRVIAQAIDRVSEDGEPAGSESEFPPMLPYAAQFWMLHARKGGSDDNEDQEGNDADFLTHCSFESKKVALLYRRYLKKGLSAYYTMDVTDAPNSRFTKTEDCLFVLTASEGCTGLVARHINSDCHRCRPFSNPSAVADDEITWAKEEQTQEQSPLQRAVFLASSRGYARTVQVLLDSVAERGIVVANVLNSRFGGQQTALWSACCKGRADLASMLLDYGADALLSARCNRQGPPLHCAASQGHLDIVKLIFKKRRHQLLELLTLLDWQGTTAVGIAVEECRPEVLRYMLDSATDQGIDIVPLLTRRWQPNTVYEHAIIMREERGGQCPDGFGTIVKDLERRLLSKLVDVPARRPERKIEGESRLSLVAVRPSPVVALAAQA